jgi:Tol biopolymer transport system component
MKRLLVCCTLAASLPSVSACDAHRTQVPQSRDGAAPLFQSFATSGWSAPEVLPAPVNSPTANDQGPALSADGLTLFFCSNRSPSLGNDLWVARRETENSPWGAPVNLGSVVNSASGDCGPSLSDDGLLLFFTSNRAGGAGANDIYVTRRADASDDLGWDAPTRLGAEVNTAATELSPFVTRVRGEDCDDENCAEAWAELYFERGTSNTASDIYVVRIALDGTTLGAAEPVAELNSVDADGRPIVRFDGREMLLHSNRDGRGGNFDLFVTTRRSPNHPWSTPRPVEELSISGRHEIHPYLSRDARTIVFVRGTGVINDIWMSTRTPGGH